MTAAVKDLKIKQGSTYRLPFQWCEKDPDAPGGIGDPYVITGWKARMQVRAKIADEGFMLEATTENGRILIDGANGKITIVLDASATMQLVKNGVYDLEVINPEVDPPDVYCLLEGKVVVDKNVTR